MKDETKVINYPYTVNSAGIYIYKSMRKNACCTNSVMINHLINPKWENEFMISDFRIGTQYVYCISEIIYTSVNKCNCDLCVSAVVDAGKKSLKKGLIQGMEVNSFHFNKRHFESVKQLLYFVYTVFCMIYPYNELNYDLIEQNESVKYWIKYYNKKGNV